MRNRLSPKRWTKLNVTLHWLIVLLIIVQFLESDFMIALWDSVTEGKAITATGRLLGWVHIVVGTSILVAAGLRLLDRLLHGRPERSVRDPGWAVGLSSATHALIYVTLLAIPILGLAAWFTGSDTLAGYHTLLWTPLMVLVGLHLAGVAWQQFVIKSDALHLMAPIIPSPEPHSSTENP